MGLILYFLRHGETASSREDRFCGNLDQDLTKTGHQMAKEFAVAYKSLQFKAIIASPMKRTIATAKPLCQKKVMKMQVEEGLREIAYGKWEGKTRDEVDREFHDDYIRWLADPGWNAPTQGEKGIDIARRSAIALQRIERTYTKGNILIVSHKATIRIILCSLLGIDLGRFRDRFDLPAGAVCIIELAIRGPLLHLMADRSYMSEKLRAKI